MKKQTENNYFFEMPQERDIKGTIEYIKNGQKKKALLVYSIPCERCNGCPMYRIDKTIEVRLSILVTTLEQSPSMIIPYSSVKSGSLFTAPAS